MEKARDESSMAGGKKEVILEAQRDKKKVHFATLMDTVAEARKEGKTVQFAFLMDICRLKDAELEPKFQKYKGRLVLRDDIVKDDSGAYAVFTEQGSSFSQMTAAKVMDIISRLPGCAGHAADAVSTYTQVKHGGCSKVVQNSKVRMSRHVDTSSTTQMAKILVRHRRPSGSASVTILAQELSRSK